MSNGVRRALKQLLLLLLVLLASACGSSQSTPTKAPLRSAETAPGSPLEGEPATQFPVESDDIVVGSNDAPVTVLLFLDFLNPDSAEAFALLETIARTYGEKGIRIALKPVPATQSPESVPATLAAQAAELLAGDRVAFAYAAKLFSSRERLGPTKYAALAEELGMGRSEFNRTMADEGTTARVGADVLLARRLGLQKVPAFFVNGRALFGIPSHSQLVALIDKETNATLALRQKKQKGEAYAARVNDNAMRSLVEPLVGEGSTLSSRRMAPGQPVPEHAEAQIPVTADDPVWGDALAPVTIVEISDFECPFCARVLPTLAQIREHYGPAKVRIVWKHNPLPFHKNARAAHEAAVAVFALGGSRAFFEFHDLLFSHQRELTEDNFKRWATESGVSAEKWEEVYRAREFSSKVDADMDLAAKIGASGTPAFRINGVTLSGAQPFEKFQEVIDAQLLEANKLAASGVKPAAIYPTLVAKNVLVNPEAKAEKPKDSPPDNTIWSVPVFPDDPVKGPKDALVTIVEFSDFQCPFCKRVSETVRKIVETYPNDVRIVWKDNPLAFHPRAIPAAILARTIYKQKGDKAFWNAHDKLFELQPRLEDADFEAAFKESGVPWPALAQALKANKFASKFDESQELATDLEARGTPHFFINGLRLAGAQPFEKFKEVIDARLAEAQKMVDSGTPKAAVYARIVKEGKVPPPPERKAIPALPRDAPTKGNKAAKVTIVEFSDFECPFCNRVNPTLGELVKEFGNDVKIVWVNMPLPFHKNAVLAAEAAYEIYTQKGDTAFWEYHDKLFAAQRAPGGIERENLEKFAREVGADLGRFRAALDERTHEKRIASDVDLAGSVGVNGTPAFLVNGYFISGAQPVSVFRKAIRLARAAK